jgi:CheY-like chemotaxis protein
VLEVSDTGCGMSAEVQARIFDPFFTTKHLGRGLGLSSVQSIIHGVGGRITVASSPNQGATFTVWLPCAAPEIRSTRPVRSVAQPPAGGKVLVVDDEAPLRQAVVSALKREGFSVLAAGDGLSAVQQFGEHAAEISAVVLDVNLPGLSGREVSAEMLRIRPDIPILVTSARTPKNKESGASQNGRFLRKPYRLRELFSALREMIAATSLQ